MLNEQLQKEINQEAKAGQHTHPGTDYGHGFNKGYDSGYKFAGEKYASKWQEAQQRAERYEKALKQIEQMSDPGDYWKAICDMKAIASEALTPKTGSDELHK